MDTYLHIRDSHMIKKQTGTRILHEFHRYIIKLDTKFTSTEFILNRKQINNKRNRTCVKMDTLNKKNGSSNHMGGLRSWWKNNNIAFFSFKLNLKSRV